MFAGIYGMINMKYDLLSTIICLFLMTDAAMFAQQQADEWAKALKDEEKVSTARSK